MGFRKEQWTPEHFRSVLGGKTVHIGSYQTTFEKVENVKTSLPEDLQKDIEKGDFNTNDFKCK